VNRIIEAIINESKNKPLLQHVPAQRKKQLPILSHTKSTEANDYDIENIFDDHTNDSPSDTTHEIAIDYDELDLPQTMVFVNTAENAQILTAQLKHRGLSCVDFHKNIFPNIRMENLEKFQNNEVKVFVCTDSASRGLDLVSVRHVVHAEFPLNVVQYLHRIGRSSRAGEALFSAVYMYECCICMLSFSD
jgi:superfamily II DNA/RNA helicase